MGFFRQAWVKILIAIILILAVSVVGVHSLRSRNHLWSHPIRVQSTPLLQEQPTPTPISYPTSAGNINDPSTWTTYSNTTDRWQMKYPPGWKIEDHFNGYISITSPDFQQNLDNRLEDEAKSGATVLYNTILQASLSDIRVGDVSEGADTVPSTKILNVTKLTIGGQPAQEYDYQEIGYPKLIKTAIETVKGGKIYTFTATYATLRLKSTFEQMLSTLKFLK